MTFSDFAVYADESGSPNLEADKDDFPVFVLVFLIVRKDVYCDHLVPAVQRLKFDFVGHDQIVLHERDIRRQSGAFAFLQVSPQQRAAFIERVNTIVETAEITLVATIIDKTKLRERYSDPWSPYDLAVTFCLERTAAILRSQGQSDREVHVVFESRGAKEDSELELMFRRVADGNPPVGRASASIACMTWKPHFVDKKCNSSGLQVADLAARPLGLRHLRPTQPNRAADVLRAKTPFPGPKVFP